MAAVSSVTRTGLALSFATDETALHTSISLGAEIANVSEDGVALVRVERGNSVVVDVLHPEGGPDGRGRREQKRERLHAWQTMAEKMGAGAKIYQGTLEGSGCKGSSNA